MGNSTEKNSSNNIAKLLREIRAKGSKSDEAAQNLASALVGENDWASTQCRDLYESILRHYIGNEQQLNLLLDISGISKEYQTISTLLERRNTYIFSHNETTDLDTLRMRENKILEEVAALVWDDLNRGKMPILVSSWMAKTDVNAPPVEEIFPTAKEIVLAPGDIFQLKVAVIPKEAVNAPLSYVSKDTSVVTVSNVGMLLAHGDQSKRKPGAIGPIWGDTKYEKSPHRTTNIVIQAESGVTATKEITVTGVGTYEDDSNFDINTFVPDFFVEQKVRHIESIKWSKAIEAQTGDIVEFQIQYKNIEDDERTNVMVRDILPPSLQYIAGSTKLYNSANKDGVNIHQDFIATDKAINIGNYKPGANAYIRFRATVLGDNLKPGSNTLVNWSQCCAKKVTLQDFAAVIVHINK